MLPPSEEAPPETARISRSALGVLSELRSPSLFFPSMLISLSPYSIISSYLPMSGCGWGLAWTGTLSLLKYMHLTWRAAGMK